MLISEAVWIGEAVEQIALTPDEAVVDVGSSSGAFRSIEQPYIDRYIFAPLRRRGCRTVHVDAEAMEGVDVVFDLASGGPVPPELTHSASLLLCCNMLEHVIDRENVLTNLGTLVRPRGMLVITVPKAFPYHADPIDTMYRPSPSELTTLLEAQGFSVQRCEEVVSPYASKLLPFGPLVPAALAVLRHTPSQRLRPRDFSVVAALARFR